MKKPVLQRITALFKKKKADRMSSSLETYLEKKKRLWDEGLKYVQSILPSDS